MERQIFIGRTEPSIVPLAVRRKGIARCAALHLDCARLADERPVSVRVGRADADSSTAPHRAHVLPRANDPFTGKYCHYGQISGDIEGCERLSNTLFSWEVMTNSRFLAGFVISRSLVRARLPAYPIPGLYRNPEVQL